MPEEPCQGREDGLDHYDHDLNQIESALNWSSSEGAARIKLVKLMFSKQYASC